MNIIYKLSLALEFVPKSLASLTVIPNEVDSEILMAPRKSRLVGFCGYLCKIHITNAFTNDNGKRLSHRFLWNGIMKVVQETRSNF